MSMGTVALPSLVCQQPQLLHSPVGAGAKLGSPQSSAAPSPGPYTLWWVLSPSIEWPAYNLSFCWQELQHKPARYSPHAALTLMNASGCCGLVWPSLSPDLAHTNAEGVCGFAWSGLPPSPSSCAPQQELWASRVVPQVPLPSLFPVPDLMCAAFSLSWPLHAPVDAAAWPSLGSSSVRWVSVW